MGILYRRGTPGSVIINKKETHSVPVVPVKKIVDTTGAGDMYAAGFLHGYVHDLTLPECGRLGAIASAEIISHFGARPEVELKSLI